MAHIYPIGLSGSHKSQLIKSTGTLGTYYIKGVPTTSLQGRGKAT